MRHYATLFCVCTHFLMQRVHFCVRDANITVDLFALAVGISYVFLSFFFYYYFLPRLWLPIGSWLPFSWLVCSLCTLQVFWPAFCWRLRTEPVTCWLRTCLHELFCRLHASWCCHLLLYAHLSMCASWRLICRTPCCIILFCRPS